MEGTRGRKGNIRQKGATVAGGVSQTGANTPTRGVHDRHKGDSRTVRTALAQGLSRRTPEAAAAVVRAPHRLEPRLPPLLLALRFVLPPSSFLRSEAPILPIMRQTSTRIPIEFTR